MHYNTKVIRYPNGSIQVRYYKNGVYKKTLLQQDIGTLEEDFYIAEYREWMREKSRNPFDGKPTKEMKDITPEEQERHKRRSMSRTVNEICKWTRSNDWEWFFTLTFSDEKIDRYDFDAVSKYLRKWLNNLKNKHCPDLKYLFVPEKHRDGGWHFHGLVANCDGLNFEVALNNAEFRPNGTPNRYYKQPLRTHYPDGDFIYNIKNYKKGHSTATRIKDSRKAGSYILKYITKDLADLTKGRQRYYKSNNLVEPVVETYLLDNLKELKQELEKQKKSISYEKTVEVTAPFYENVVTYIEIE